MKKAIILHSISDVKHCINEKAYVDAELYSTHSAVDVYLKEYHGLECHCLSEFLSLDETNIIIEDAYSKVDAILRELDENNKEVFKNCLGVQMRYFVPLFAYLGIYHYTGYIFLVETIKRMMSTREVEEINIYNYIFDESFGTQTNIHDLVETFFNNKNVTVIENSQKQDKFEKIKAKGIWALQKFRRPKLFYSKLKALYKRRFEKPNIDNSKKTVLLYGPLYELEFLRQRLVGQYNILTYESGAQSPNGFKYEKGNGASLSISDLNFELHSVELNDFDRILLKDMKDYCKATLSKYIESLLYLKEFISRTPVDVAIWGNPPIGDLPSLTIEFLQKSGVKVVGAQHGGSYGDSVVPKHYISDYDRCDHFISYGYDENDLKRSCPNLTPNAKIHPFGKSRLPHPQEGAKSIGIVYPVTNSKSMIYGGMLRIPPHELTKRQIRILEYLDGLDNVDVHVKPFPNANYQNCSILPVLKRLRNVKIIQGVNFMEFLQRNKPACTIVELPSTPQYEVFHLDTEILLMDEWVDPFEDEALRILEKRVHFTKDLEVMIKNIESYVKNDLPKKRNPEFFDKYIHRDSREESIVRFLDALINNKDEFEKKDDKEYQAK